MKTIAALLGMLALVVGVLAYNVWRAGTEVLVPKPGVVEQQRMALHQQLLQGAQREAEIEKLYWNAPEKLQVLIRSHQTRIGKLAGNPAGSEIVAHDKDAIARLEKRIADVEAQREAQAAAQAEAAKQQAEAAKLATQDQ